MYCVYDLYGVVQRSRFALLQLLVTPFYISFSYLYTVWFPAVSTATVQRRRALSGSRAPDSRARRQRPQSTHVPRTGYRTAVLRVRVECQSTGYGVFP